MSADLELCYLPATEALRRFKDRSLSPVELMQAVITRAEAVKDPVNALTYTFFDEALANAHKAEGKYARGGRPRALEGLLIAIKDENNIKGKRVAGIQHYRKTDDFWASLKVPKWTGFAHVEGLDDRPSGYKNVALTVPLSLFTDDLMRNNGTVRAAAQPVAANG